MLISNMACTFVKLSFFVFFSVEYLKKLVYTVDTHQDISHVVVSNRNVVAQLPCRLKDFLGYFNATRARWNFLA